MLQSNHWYTAQNTLALMFGENTDKEVSTVLMVKSIVSRLSHPLEFPPKRVSAYIPEEFQTYRPLGDENDLQAVVVNRLELVSMLKLMVIILSQFREFPLINVSMYTPDELQVYRPLGDV